MTPNRSNRRRAERIRLSKPFVCRLGSSGVVLVDISNFGARVEHYARIERGTRKTLRIRFDGEEISMPAEVVACRVERFMPGDQGLTVYRSGIRFLEEEGSQFERIKKLTSSYVASTLVEQVANARGFMAPVTGEMPIFRNGSLASNRFDIGSNRLDEHLLPSRDLTRKTGFIRYSFDKGRWNRKWTLDANQPVEGFTVSANETWEQVELLCDLYRRSDPEGRDLIRTLASASLEGEFQNSSP
ncbi:MAG: PilZ domain-containing protein [Thermoanaerobaculia bacterium]